VVVTSERSPRRDALLQVGQDACLSCWLSVSAGLGIRGWSCAKRPKCRELSHIQKPSPSKWGLLFLISFLVSSASLTLLMFLSLYGVSRVHLTSRKNASLSTSFSMFRLCGVACIKMVHAAKLEPRLEKRTCHKGQYLLHNCPLQ
jgi:hypothetical protein